MKFLMGSKGQNPITTWLVYQYLLFRFFCSNVPTYINALSRSLFQPGADEVGLLLRGGGRPRYNPPIVHDFVYWKFIWRILHAGTIKNKPTPNFESVDIKWLPRSCTEFAGSPQLLSSLVAYISSWRHTFYTYLRLISDISMNTEASDFKYKPKLIIVVGLPLQQERSLRSPDLLYIPSCPAFRYPADLPELGISTEPGPLALNTNLWSTARYFNQNIGW